MKSHGMLTFNKLYRLRHPGTTAATADCAGHMKQHQQNAAAGLHRCQSIQAPFHWDLLIPLGVHGQHEIWDDGDIICVKQVGARQ